MLDTITIVGLIGWLLAFAPVIWIAFIILRSALKRTQVSVNTYPHCEKILVNEKGRWCFDGYHWSRLSDEEAA